jgi:cyanophycinase-like exopeptidase
MRMRVCLIVMLSLVTGLPVSTQGPSSVGPSRGTVVLASAQTPVILTRFIELAGGAESPIVLVATAALNKPGGPQIGFRSSTPDAALKALGAKNVTVIHTFDRAVADSDAFVEPLTRAAGVWFAGGMPEYLLDSYADTRVVVELRKVLDRGGVIGGISAGAVVLASETVNGSLGADRQWVVRRAFGFLRGVAFQPHAQATPKMESWMVKRTDLVRIASDNAAAWVVRGDVAEIVGDGNAYVYEQAATAAGARFDTLRAGDRYDLAARRKLVR